MKNKINKNKITIGFIIDWLSNKYQISLFQGIADTAAKKGVNIICFPGGAIDSNKKYEKSLNSLYGIISNKVIDGLIISSGTIGKYVDNVRLRNFCYDFKPLPIVSVSKTINGIPSILVNNEIGMYRLTKHLIEVHKYKKIVFIKGDENNEDNEERIKGFMNAVNEHNISENNYFFINGDFTHESGISASLKLLNIKEKYDVIICANDDMAYGVYDGFMKNGIMHNELTPIVGFDDIDFINIKAPSLTTVKQPIFDQGRQALLTILDLINGKSVNEKNILPSSLIIRESCGCISEKIKNIFLSSKNKTTEKILKKDYSEEFLRKLKRNINKKYNMKEEIYFEISKKMVDSIVTQINEPGKNTIFLNELNSILSDYVLKINLIDLNNILSEIRKLFLIKLNDKEKTNLIESLVEQAGILISEKIILLEKSKNYDIFHAIESVVEIGNEIILAVDNKENMLEKHFKDIGVESCYISMIYNEGKMLENELKFILGYDRNGKVSINDNEKIFPNKNLMPLKYFPENRNYSMICLPLCSTFDHLGFVMLEVDPFNKIYFNMPCQTISSALHKGLLYIQIKNQAKSLHIQKEEMSRSIERLRIILSGFIYAMTQTIELRDPYTAGHQRRVSELARSIAQNLKLNEDKVESIRVAGIVHDLGKISVPSEILNKPGKLNESEFNLIKDHPQLGYEILKSIDFPWPIAEMVLQHHERLDGSGYPHGLRGEGIMLEARILCVADVVEAIASHRPYRPALGIEAALTEISKKSGIYYDPMVVDACLDLFKHGYNLDIRNKKAI